MRWLMWFAVGFGAACGCSVYLQNAALWLYAPLVLAFVASLWINARMLRVMAVLLAGFAMGQLWFGIYQSVYLRDANALHGVTGEMAIRASDYSEQTPYGMAVDGTLTLNNKPYQVRAYLDSDEQVVPGQQLTGDFFFRLTTPDGAATYHAGKGIFLLAYQRGEITREQTASRWRDIPAKLRMKIKDTLKIYFSEESYPFAQALLLGDTRELSYAVDTSLKVSGIRHVVAVSGLHVSILFGLISTLTLRRRFLTALLGFPALLLFAALAGFTPSITRSCLMCALLLLSNLANREYDGATALSFAVLVILLVNPLAAAAVGFQLSVASVAGIYLFRSKIYAWLKSKFRSVKGKGLRARLIRWFTGTISVTLSATAITTPLCAWYFGMVSLVSVLTNLLTLWVISGIFCGIAGVCLLHFVMPTLAGILAAVVTIGIRYVLWVAKSLAGLPMAAVYTISPYVIAWLIFLGCLLLVLLLRSNRRPVVLGCCAVLGLCVSLTAGWIEPVLDAVRFTVLDVGQGQCLLFQTEGKTVLVDCGGDSDTEAADLAAETLLSQGIDHLDVMILTHLDEDHTGGAEKLLTRMDTELLIMPYMHTTMDTGRANTVVYATDNLELSLEKSKVTVFSPGFPGDGNEMSLCVLFDTEKCDILVTGDRGEFGERMLLRRQTLPEVDVLVAGHHGSQDATCEELLAAVRPKIVCISVGADNPYGQPAPEVLERLDRFGCRVFRTDTQGTITIRR